MKTTYDFSVFCNNFSVLRQKENISINEISKATGVNLWELLSIEVGTDPKIVSCNTLLKLCDYFDISISDIFAPVK